MDCDKISGDCRFCITNGEISELAYGDHLGCRQASFFFPSLLIADQSILVSLHMAAKKGIVLDMYHGGAEPIQTFRQFSTQYIEQSKS